MNQSFGDQRAAWPRRVIQGEDESDEWASTSSSYSWSPPAHTAVRIPGITMTSEGGVRPRHSPPPYVNQREYHQIDRPGVRERCWNHCAALNAAHSNESLIDPQFAPVQEPMQLGATRQRASSSASRVSRIMNSASIRSKESVSSASSAFSHAASSVIKRVSDKGRSMVQRLASHNHIDKSTISQPLSMAKASDIARTDFSATNREMSRSPVITETGSLPFEPGRLKRQQAFTDLHHPVHRHHASTTHSSLSNEYSDYQNFVAAAVKNDQQRQAEMLLLAELENCDHSTVLFDRYLRDKEPATAETYAAPSLQRAQSSEVQEALKRVTLVQTGETMYFI